MHGEDKKLHDLMQRQREMLHAIQPLMDAKTEIYSTLVTGQLIIEPDGETHFDYQMTEETRDTLEKIDEAIERVLNNY